MKNKKLTPYQKVVVIWMVIGTVLGSVMIFVSIVSRHRQLQEQADDRGAMTKKTLSPRLP